MADIYRDIEAEIPRLRRYALVLVRDGSGADDLVQDCLTRALEKLHLWQEGSNLRAWLFAILHNQHINQVRRNLRSGSPVQLNEADPQLSRPASQDKRLELRDLERALARLPEEQRAAILLVGLEGFAYQQVADILGVPTGTVRSRISRGRDALRRLMGAEPGSPADQPDERVPPRSTRASASSRRHHGQASLGIANAASPVVALPAARRPVRSVPRPQHRPHVSQRSFDHG